MIFWNVEHWIAKLGGQRSICHWPTTQIISFTSSPPQKNKSYKLQEPEGNYHMHTFLTTN
jgi:hypothetical protein